MRPRQFIMIAALLWFACVYLLYPQRARIVNSGDLMAHIRIGIRRSARALRSVRAHSIVGRNGNIRARSAPAVPAEGERKINVGQTVNFSTFSLLVLLVVARLRAPDTLPCWQTNFAIRSWPVR